MKKGIQHQAVTRNLTPTFMHHRSEHYRSTGPRGGQGGRWTDAVNDAHVYIELEAGERTIRTATLPPRWMEHVEDANSDIKSIKSKLVNLTKLQQRRILKVFDDGAQADEDIENESLRITNLVRHCEGCIHEIKAGVHQPATSEVEELMRKNAQNNLATQLQHLTQNFRHAQKVHTDAIQRWRKRSKWEPENCNANRAASVGFTGEQLTQLEDLSLSASQRSEEINHIASSVEGLHTIFKELAVLVIDQGSIMDRIDCNILKAAEDSRKAKDQLQDTERAQKKSRATHCIVILALMNAFLILFLLAKQRT